jgi:hypothetical protein
MAIFKDPDGVEAEYVTGPPEVVAEAAKRFILNMITDDEQPLPCSVEVVRVRRRTQRTA